MSMSIWGKNYDLFLLIIKTTLIFTTIQKIQRTHIQNYLQVITHPLPKWVHATAVHVNAYWSN